MIIIIIIFDVVSRRCEGLAKCDMVLLIDRQHTSYIFARSTVELMKLSACINLNTFFKLKSTEKRRLGGSCIVIRFPAKVLLRAPEGGKKKKRKFDVNRAFRYSLSVTS